MPRRRNDAGRALILRLRPHPAGALGDDDELMTLTLQPGAHDFFGAPGGGTAATKRVDIRRIQQIDPSFGSGVEDGVAAGLVTLAANVIVPRQRCETRNLVLPSLMCCMGSLRES